MCDSIMQQKTIEIEYGDDDLDLLRSKSFKVCGKDFSVIKLVGTGGYGKVYKVVKNGGVDDKHVLAMKVVRKAKIIDNVKDTAHTKSERSVLASSRHPFIVELIYTFQTPTCLYFIMEFCFGGEVFQLLENMVRLPLDAVRFYMAEITLALEYLHRLNVVYRDLKPENIMLDGEGHVKLTDFGMSKKIGTDCLTYTFCGTVDYMAPEVLQRCGHGIAVDWWTLGAVSYDMLVGQPPFVHRTREGTIRRVDFYIYEILYYQVEFPQILGSDDFIDLINGLLAKDPSVRMGVEQVKSHSFFDIYSWEDVYYRKLTPPFNNISIKNRRSHNSEYSTISSLEGSEHDSPAFGKDEFQGFSYVADSLLRITAQKVTAEKPPPERIYSSTESLNMSDFE